MSRHSRPGVSAVSAKWKVFFVNKLNQPIGDAQMKGKDDLIARKNARIEDECNNEFDVVLVGTDLSRNDVRHVNRILVLTAFFFMINQLRQLGFTEVEGFAEVRKSLIEKCIYLLSDINILLDVSLTKDMRQSVRQQLFKLHLFQPRRAKSYLRVENKIFQSLDERYAESTQPRTNQARKLSKSKNGLKPGRVRR